MKLRLPSFLRKILFENSDNPLAPNFKKRKLLHSAFLIECIVSLLGIGLIGMIPLVIILMQIPWFTLSFVISIVTSNLVLVILTKHYEGKENV